MNRNMLECLRILRRHFGYNISLPQCKMLAEKLDYDIDKALKISRFSTDYEINEALKMLLGGFDERFDERFDELRVRVKDIPLCSKEQTDDHPTSLQCPHCSKEFYTVSFGPYC